MTDEELRRYVHQAVDHKLSGVRMDNQLTQRVLHAPNGEETVKKRLTLLPAMVLIIALLTMAAAAAEALGIHIFELFGKTDERYAQLAPQAVLEQTSPVNVSSPELGDVIAAINNAYYDGETLMVAYSIQGARRLEAFTPDEALLNQMEPFAYLPGWDASQDAERAALLAQWQTALKAHTPMGLVQWSVYPSDHTTTDDGVDLPPSSEDYREGENGTVYAIREYEMPLPDEVLGRDRLLLRIGLYRSVTYWYWDGESLFTLTEREQLDPMTAEVWRIDAERRAVTGNGYVGDIGVTVAGMASAANVQLTLTFDAALPSLGEDTYYYCYLLDEAGRSLQVDYLLDGTLPQQTFTFEGSGKMPEALTLFVLAFHEGPWDLQEAIKGVDPIRLTLVKNE